MNEKQFERMDREWMKSTQPIRDKKVSDGILKGFAVSVERRILGAAQETSKKVRTQAWVPAMAVLVIASAVVLRTPTLTQPTVVIPQTVEYAQLPVIENLNEEIAALKEVGAWSDADDALLGAGEEADMEDLELSGLSGGQTNMA